ncbi:MAG: macro domain-containing protein [Sandaracinus sp.]|nr:macro domain-containing protein [Sandaracinus sp.]
MQIGTFVGSLTDPALGADALVNASNPEVALGSGVSAAIREACGGLAYQRAIREALDDEFGEPLEADDCLVTDAGVAKAFRHVLHVPAVDFRRRGADGAITNADRVARCTRAAVAAADELAEGTVSSEGTSSRGKVSFVLAMPLLGAGVGGLGEVRSAEVMLSELAQRPPRFVSVVRFAVLRDEHARLVRHAAERAGLALEPG